MEYSATIPQQSNDPPTTPQWGCWANTINIHDLVCTHEEGAPYPIALSISCVYTCIIVYFFLAVVKRLFWPSATPSAGHFLAQGQEQPCGPALRICTADHFLLLGTFSPLGFPAIYLIYLLRHKLSFSIFLAGFSCLLCGQMWGSLAPSFL